MTEPGAPEADPTAQASATERTALPDALPILPLRGAVLFPAAIAPIPVGRQRSLRLVDDAMRSNRLLAFLAARNLEVEEPGPDDVYRVGTAARILQLMRLGDGSVRLIVQGIERVRVVDFLSEEPYLLARIEPLPDRVPPASETEGLRRAILDQLRRITPLLDQVPEELAATAENLTDPRELAYLAASVVPLSVEQRQMILELDPLDAKLRRLVELVQEELSARELGRSIADQTRDRITRQNREAMLREQLRSIQDELGQGEGGGEVAELRRRLDEAGLPDEARAEVDRELGRLASIPEASPEHGLIRSWLEWMADLPWSRMTGSEIEVAKARRVLDEDHYDLNEVKRRILEYLAVRKLRRERRADVGLDGSGEDETGAGGPVGDDAGPAMEATVAPTTPADEATREPILVFVGPPGVGKTSLGQSIARALGRKFIRMSLGGVRDEAEIRGHRRTYIGALPGRMIQGIRRSGTRDPVFMLDEIDKVGSDWRGDPTAALLEVLDPAQNHSFVDNYLGVPFDLSQVLFIATANTLDTIPAPLLDRMEILRIAGYTEDEKVRIAERYLIPQQLRAHGLRDDEVEFDHEAIRQVVRGYTREAGVRDLDRRIAAILRKVAMRVAEAAERGAAEPAERGAAEGAPATNGEGERPAVPTRVTPDALGELLGRARFFDETVERTERPGVATGLAWTPTGGEVLFIEAAMLPDGGDSPLLLTGMLGDVMRESAQAALTYIWSEADRLGIPAERFTGKRLHIHVPAGALPKDGPSAGVAMATAIASLALGRPVREHVAMTGEITLRGKVLPVGGIKEKVLAAHRAGIRTVILPRRNEGDLDEIPPELRAELTIKLVDDVDEVLAEALGIEPLRRDVGRAIDRPVGARMAAGSPRDSG